MKKLLLIALLPFFLTPCFGVEDSTPQQIIGPFGTLNNTDDPMVLQPNMAQDLLNVEITDGGRSVRKRKGLGLAFTLPNSSSVVHGIYSFYDASGNDVSLFFNDSKLSGSVNGAAITTVFSTGTVAATWQCTDSLGYAYCASTSREPIIKTNGATYTQVLPMTSIGTMVTATTQRLVTAGFSGSPSQINFSGANNFSDWTLGGLVTSAYNETINAPGSRITHIVAACNGLMWFKETSFGIILNPDDALNAQNVTLAPEIGTLDNTSVIYPGGLQFRAQDGHIYNYDCAGIEKLTRDITPTINASGSRRSNSWTQTTASDFNAGISTPSLNVSTTSSSGDIVFNGIISTETSSTQWSLGTASNMTVGTSSITLTLNNSGTVTNPSFESVGTSVAGSSWTNSCSNCFQRSPDPNALVGCTGVAQSGSWYELSSNATSMTFEVIDLSSNILASQALTNSANCSYTQSTLSSPSNAGKRVKFRLHGTGGNCQTFCGGPWYLTTTESYIFSGSISFYSGSDGASNPDYVFDNIQNGSSTITTGSFTSQMFDLGFASSTIQLSTFNYTANTSTPTFSVITATGSTGPWYTLTSSSNTWALGNRYARYTTTITINSSDNALTAITAAILTRSTGTYYSAVHNAPSLTSWDTLAGSKQDNGGTHTFFTRSSTTFFTTLSSTPAWVAQTFNGVVSASTGTYFQMRDDFTITYSTQTPTINDFTFNWFEGTASDKPYAIYFGKDNALWWSVASGDGQSTNNRILRWDLINHGWTIYDIPANGFLIRNQNLYIGSSSTGTISKYGDTDSDNGTAINSYWQSKDFIGENPMVDKEFRTLSVVAKSVSSSSMTVTYEIDGSSSTAYTVPLYNSSGSILRNNRYLPAGRVGNTFNVMFGNNAADQYWELFGGAFSYKPKPWMVGN